MRHISFGLLNALGRESPGAGNDIEEFIARIKAVSIIEDKNGKFAGWVH